MVGIGEALARKGVFEYEEGQMPKGVHLSDSARVEIANKVNHEGCDPSVVASDLGLSEQYVRRLARKFARAEELELERETTMKVLAGNKQDGQLRCTGPDTYEGTCRLRNGKFARKMFHATGVRTAQAQWERWCERVREQDLSPEPFAKTVAPAANDAEPVVDAVEPEAVPEIVVRPWRDVAEERQRRIDELEAQVAELQARVDSLGAATAGSVGGHAYLLWTKSEGARAFGLYRTMETAIEKVDELNEVASFLGSSGAFDVEEVEWRG